MSAEKRREIAQATLQIIKQGYYYVGDKKIPIQTDLLLAKKGTVNFPPEHSLWPTSKRFIHTDISVTEETTLQAARRLCRENVVLLNFASAKNPGGGFLRGTLAQEETLAYASGLHECLVSSTMYTMHRQQKNPLYTDHMIYSPGVPFFRDDNFNLLPKYYCASIITSPAVNAGAVPEKDGDKVKPAMQKRIHRIVQLAASMGHDTLVLGAYGCGVFQNDPTYVAAYFQEALAAFPSAFETVVFAIYDRTKDQRVLKTFQKQFDSSSNDGVRLR